MRNLTPALAAFALVACQSAQEVPQPAAAEHAAPAFIAPQPALSAAAVPPGSASGDQSLTIVPPGKDVPPRYAAFTGTWIGQLHGTSEGRLDVQSVSANGDVTVNYAWGILGDNNPGEAAGTGKILGTTLKLGRLPNGADISFLMLPDGTLAATYTLAGKSYRGVFARQ
ncbi:hypothetical protein C7I87_32730 [Mesorhizobium sp. SARCC-RB16n]|nr:hypothetical protein C7I87_32730 [Mesorhizobium sp. SARCC-RB16n]